MSDARTKFIDYDARRDPKTDRWCVACQKDLRPGKPFRVVYVDDQMHAVHPADLPDRGTVAGDFGWSLIGTDCAKRLGVEWTCEDAFEAPSRAAP